MLTENPLREDQFSRRRTSRITLNLLRIALLQLQDGDNSTSSAWTCSGESACEITYDLQAIESVEQIRIGRWFVC